MDGTASMQSDLLQNRLRERKAEAALNSARHRQTSSIDTSSRRVTAGRDDNIFDAEVSPPMRPSARAFQSSPAVPPSRAESKTTTSSRRPSGLNASANSQPRSMGARELESHVDKLSKENFSLKMEVYHQREKNEKLEKRVKELQDFDEQNAELQAINEDLYIELENRDRAVDEAVVMITDLEQRIRELEEERSSTRPSTAPYDKSSKSRTTTSESHSVSPPKRRPPMLHHIETPKRSGISQETSAHMAELSTPTRQDIAQRSKLLPSFLLDNEPSTGTLRSLFVQENKTVRAIPSHASLLSKQTARDDEDDVPRSPGLSVLSEREFASVYGHDEQTNETSRPSIDESAANVEEELPIPSADAEHLSKAQRMARTDRWVADAAQSASKAQTSPRNVSPNPISFPSIGNVLQESHSLPEPDSESPTKPRKRQLATLSKDVTKHTPPISGQPLFGQNVFPPTPDTMTTRPLNHSTSSISHERSAMDGFLEPNKMFGTHVLTGSAQQGSQSSSKRNSLLPQELDAYGDSGSSAGDQEETAARIVNEFGKSLFQTHGSDGFSVYATPMSTRYHSAREGSIMSGSDGFTDAPPRSSPSPPRVFNSRRLSVDGTTGSYIRPSTHLLHTDTEPLAPTTTSNIVNNTTTAPTTFQRQRYEHALPSVITTQSTINHDAAALTNSLNAPSTINSAPTTPPKPIPSDVPNRPPQHTSSLRQRMTKLARRAHVANLPTYGKGAEEITDSSGNNSASTPESVGRRNPSISRSFFRRRSRTRGESAVADSADEVAAHGSSGATSAFVQAANRAAPHLPSATSPSAGKGDDYRPSVILIDGTQRSKRSNSSTTDVRPRTAVSTAGIAHGGNGQTDWSAWSRHNNESAGSFSPILANADMPGQWPLIRERRESMDNGAVSKVTDRSRSRSKTKVRRGSWTLPQIDATGAGKRF